MYSTNLRKVGGSVMLAVPPAILDLLHLQAGAAVGLAVDGERLVMERRVKPRYTLGELLLQYDASAEKTAEEQAWIDVAPVGLEI